MSETLSPDDVILHIANFGFDVFPPIEIPSERTRLNMFFEHARDAWPELYQELSISDVDFKVAARFKKIPFETLVLTNRGPVFRFPIVLPPPVEATNLEGTYMRLFDDVRRGFFQSVVGRKIIRLGLIRELIFGTGGTLPAGLLRGPEEFSGAKLVGGNALLEYRDQKCNVRVQLAPVQVTKTTQLPVGQMVTEPAGFGLRVVLDVNNIELRQLTEDDIQEVLDRACSLWPAELLGYLRERGVS